MRTCAHTCMSGYAPSVKCRFLTLLVSPSSSFLLRCQLTPLCAAHSTSPSQSITPRHVSPRKRMRTQRPYESLSSSQHHLNSPVAACCLFPRAVVRISSPPSTAGLLMVYAVTVNSPIAPQAVLSLTHSHGTCTALAWYPHACETFEPLGSTQIDRIGILAAIFADGTVQVRAIPRPSADDTETSGCVQQARYDARPDHIKMTTGTLEREAERSSLLAPSLVRSRSQLSSSSSLPPLSPLSPLCCVCSSQSVLPPGCHPLLPVRVSFDRPRHAHLHLLVTRGADGDAGRRIQPRTRGRIRPRVESHARGEETDACHW